MEPATPSIFDAAGRGSTAYPGEQSFPREADRGRQGGYGGDEEQAPDVVEGPAFTFQDDLPEAVSVVISVYALDGTPSPLGPGLPIDCTISEIVRAYPEAMPKSGEREKTFVATPVNAAGRRLAQWNRRFSIREEHQAVRELYRARVEKSASAGGAGTATVDKVIDALLDELRATRMETKDLRTQVFDETRRIGEERVNAGNLIATQVGSSYNTLLERSGELAANSNNAITSALLGAAEAERARTEAFLARLEGQAEKERLRAAERLAEINAQSAARVAEIKAESEAQLERMRQDAADRRRQDEDLRRERAEGEARLAEARERVSAELELARIRADEVRREAVAGERDRDRQIHEANMKAANGPTVGLTGMIKTGLELLAIVGVQPATLKAWVTTLVSGGGGGGEGVGVTIVKEIGSTLRQGIKAVQGLPGDLDPRDPDDPEGDDPREPDEPVEEEPAQRRPRREEVRAGEALEEGLPGGAQGGARPQAPSASPRATPAPTAPPPGPSPEDVALSRLAPELVSQARALLNDMVDTLDGLAQNEWAGAVGPLLIEHKATLEPYLRAVKVRRALKDAGASDDLARDVVAVGSAAGLWTRDLL